MKRKFVTYSLSLCVLLIAAMPVQVFAATKCSAAQNEPCAPSSYNGSGYNNCYNAGNYNDCYNLSNLKEIYNVNCSNNLSKIFNNNCYINANTDCKTVKCNTSINNNSNNCSPNTWNCSPAKPEAPVTPSKPVTPEKPATPQTPSENSGSISAYEQQVVDLVNKERAAAGLAPLKINTKLSAVAEKKAEDLRDKNYFSHTSPTYGSPFDMMSQFGIKYTAAGENIAKGQRTPSSVMSGWMNSSGHRANILSTKYDQIGVGYVTDSKGGTYWVQMFIR